jgi:hypothetical protein
VNTKLTPAENMSLTVALEQVKRGEVPTDNVASLCVLTLARLCGKYNYLEEQ